MGGTCIPRAMFPTGAPMSVRPASSSMEQTLLVDGASLVDQLLLRNNGKRICVTSKTCCLNKEDHADQTWACIHSSEFAEFELGMRRSDSEGELGGGAWLGGWRPEAGAECCWVLEGRQREGREGRGHPPWNAPNHACPPLPLQPLHPSNVGQPSYGTTVSKREYAHYYIVDWVPSSPP